MSVCIENLAKGVQGYYIQNNRFNTTLLTYNFYIPLESENMAANALLPYLLTSCSDRYRDFIDLNVRLLELYGADLSCSAIKCGDYFRIKFGISVINSELSFDGTDPVSDAAELINGLLFAPAVKDGRFYDNDLAREKRKTIERIEGEINNKRSFARTRLMEEMFGNDPYGKFSYGTVEEVEAIDSAQLHEMWRKLLSTAYLRVVVVGKEYPKKVFEQAKESFSGIMRDDVVGMDRFVAIPEADEVKTVTERIDVNQGKLAMGFTAGMHGNLKTTAALSLFTDMFGGGPYSKLFENVREKQSLCYYCSASSRRSKGFITVESGVEEANADKTISAVLKELSDMQNGCFEDKLIDAAKKSIIDSLQGCNDSATAMDQWYTRELGDFISFEEAAEIISKITRDEIIEAAKGVKLHTVYKLLPMEGEE